MLSGWSERSFDIQTLLKYRMGGFKSWGKNRGSTLSLKIIHTNLKKVLHIGIDGKNICDVTDDVTVTNTHARAHARTHADRHRHTHFPSRVIQFSTIKFVIHVKMPSIVHGTLMRRGHLFVRGTRVTYPHPVGTMCVCMWEEMFLFFTMSSFIVQRMQLFRYLINSRNFFQDSSQIGH